MEQNDPQYHPYEWDTKVIHPFNADYVAATVSASLCIGVGYARRAFIEAYVAYDLIEW